ncbi:MAG: hypothetical protein ACI80V_003623 [Rhodothermales bacterium]|jgi:hypothetical protein
MKLAITRGIWGLAMVLSASFFAACDTGTFDPFDNDDHYFTVFGYLDQLSLNHSVRVIPITRFAADIPAVVSPQATIDAVVTSTDVRTGSVTRWDHSLELLDDGNYGHIFRARFQVLEGRTYRLDVTRNDGIVTSAETTVPRLPITIPSPDTLFFPYETAPESGLSQEVYLPDIPSPWEIMVVYDLQGRQFRLPYGRPGARTEDGGWRFTIDLGVDTPRLKDLVGLTENDALPLLHAITLQVRLLDSAWDPPDGVFDPEVLAQPGVISNVQKGYGLWSSIGLYQYTWIAPPQ